MKKLFIKVFLGLFVSTFLIFAIATCCKAALKNAYDEGSFSGYADGYLKHKYYPESNEYFVYDEKLLTYLSVLTEVYITPDKMYHRDGCVPNGKIIMIKYIFNEYSPCSSCCPPAVLR